MIRKRILHQLVLLAAIGAAAASVYAGPLRDRTVPVLGWIAAKIDCNLGGCGTPCYPANPSEGTQCSDQPIHPCDDNGTPFWVWYCDALGDCGWVPNPDHYCNQGFNQCPCAEGARYGWTTATYGDPSVAATVLCTKRGDWCVTPTTLRIEGSEPIPWESIDWIEGTRGSTPFQVFANPANLPVPETSGVDFSYRAHSTFGDYSAQLGTTVRVDTVPPLASISSPPGGQWVRGAVGVSGTAADATSGVASAQISGDGGAWQAASGTTSWSATWDSGVGGDGPAQMCARATDNALHVGPQACVSVNVDNTPPSTTASPSGTPGLNGWWRSVVLVTLSASDGAGVGLAGSQYRIDAAPGDPWLPYGGPFAVAGDGAHVVEYRSADTLGNQEPAGSLTVRIDTVPPATNAQLVGLPDLGGWYSGAVTVILGASDAASGVDRIMLDGGLYGGPAPYSADGSYSLPYYAVDIAGNVEPARSVSFNIDNTPPSTTASPSGTPGNAPWWRSVVLVTLSATDGAGVGVTGSQYRIDPGPGDPWLPYGGPLPVAGEGSHTVEYRSADGLGNQEPAGSLALSIDTLPPVTDAQLLGPLGLHGYYTGTVTVALAACDAPSGPDGVYLDGAAISGPVSYTVDGAYALPYYAVDAAGNSEAVRTLSFDIDTAPPAASVTGGAFRPGYGEKLPIQLQASDRASGIASWRLELRRGSLLRLWSGAGAPPASVVWDGRDGADKIVDAADYSLHLWVQDGAGWGASALGSAGVRPVDAPPEVAPTPTSTPTPTPRPTTTPEPTEAPAPEPLFIPAPPPPEPTSTPAAVAEAAAEPPARRADLQAIVYEDRNADALWQAGERGLPGLHVHVSGPGGWEAEFATGEDGMVFVSLPGPGDYVLTLLDRPGPEWQPTTGTSVEIRVNGDGSIDGLAAQSAAVGLGLAFGLAFRRVSLWLALSGAALLGVAAVTVLGLRARSLAVRDLEAVFKLTDRR